MADVESERWRTRDPGRRAHGLAYVRALAEGGRYGLTIWPPHCVLGTPGHAVHGRLAPALRRWSEARLRPLDVLLKGGNPDTEHYSAIRADVPATDDASTLPALGFVRRLEAADEIVVAGEALDYCVLTLSAIFWNSSRNSPPGSSS